MTTDTQVQQLVDEILDVAFTNHPTSRWSITISPENSLLLPVQANEVPGSRDHVDGAYRGHVYRGCMVWDQAVQDYLIVVQPVIDRDLDRARPTYFGDLRSATWGMSPPSAGD